MALFGNAHTIDTATAQQDFARLLGQGEQVHAAYLLIRDTILFTDRRLLLVDKQGITGKKVEYHSVPYRSITHFAVETMRHVRPRRGAQDLGLGHLVADPEDLHQGCRHLRGAGDPHPVRGEVGSHAAARAAARSIQSAQYASSAGRAPVVRNSVTLPVPHALPLPR